MKDLTYIDAMCDEFGARGAFAVCERQDDVCATAFLYLRDAQPVPRSDATLAIAQIERRAWDQASPFEAMAAAFAPQR